MTDFTPEERLAGLFLADLLKTDGMSVKEAEDMFGSMDILEAPELTELVVSSLREIGAPEGAALIVNESAANVIE